MNELAITIWSCGCYGCYGKVWITLFVITLRLKFDFGMHGIAPGVGNYGYDFVHAWMSELLQL